MNEVTVIIVSHNTRELLMNCINSIRKYHFNIKIIVVDGSNKNHPCHEYASGLRSRRGVTPVVLGFNIGHGRGLKMGASMVETDYFLTIDSDATLLNGDIIPQMLQVLKKSNSYGIGNVVNVDSNGVNVIKGIPYLHPYFSLIKKSIYNLYPHPINHGAPMIKTMVAIHEKNTHPVQHIDLNGLVKHDGRGTRRLSPKEFKPKNWDSI